MMSDWSLNCEAIRRHCKTSILERSHGASSHSSSGSPFRRSAAEFLDKVPRLAANQLAGLNFFGE